MHKKSPQRVAAILLGSLLLAGPVFAGPFWTYQRASGDAVVEMAVLPAGGGESTALVIGMHSGHLVRLKPAAGEKADVLWDRDLGSSVLALAAGPDVDGDGRPDVIAGARLGKVVCLSSLKGDELWAFDTKAITSTAALLPDIDGDKMPEVAVGGSDATTFLLSGKTGAQIWRAQGSITPFRFASPGDVNGDGKPDLAIWCGSLEMLSGSDGALLWGPSPRDWFTDGLAVIASKAGPAELVSCSGRSLSGVSAKDGKTLWTTDIDRLRSIVTADIDGKDGSEIIAATGAGNVICLPATGISPRKPLWTAELGGVCREVIASDDLNGDKQPDILACSDNGVVVALAGLSGKPIWRWQAGDTVRRICAVGDTNGDGVTDFAAGSIDGAVTLLPGKSKELPLVTTLKPPAMPEPPALPKVKPPATVTGQVPIPLYHDILATSKDLLFVQLDTFIAHLDLLVSGGYTCVSLDEVLEWLQRKRPLPEHPVCLTFDGPYAGQYTFAFPELKKRGFTCALYVLTDWVGMPGRLDWHELREMQAGGVFRIENHTVHHPRLTQLTRDAVEFQLRECSRQLAEHVGGNAGRHHAYPEGDWNKALARLVEELGFHTATIAFPSANVLPGCDPMALPRYMFSQRTPLARYRECISYPADH